MAAACGRDETGLVGVVLWDKQIDEVRIGDIIRFESGWCQMRDGELIVSTGINLEYENYRSIIHLFLINTKFDFSRNHKEGKVVGRLSLRPIHE